MDNQSELAAGDGERDMIGEGKATIEELSMSGKHEGYTMSKQSEAVAAAALVQGYTMSKQSEAVAAAAEVQGYTMSKQSEAVAAAAEVQGYTMSKQSEAVAAAAEVQGHTMSKQSEAVAAAAEVQGYTMVKQSEAATAGTRGGEKPEATALVVADASCRGRGPGNGMDTDRFNRNVNRASNLSEARAV
jgi:hypothetical protein